MIVSSMQMGFVIGLMKGDEVAAKAWIDKVAGNGDDLVTAISDLIERREAGLPCNL